MKVLRWINFLLVIVLLSACGSNASGTGTPSAPLIKNPFVQDTPTPLPTAAVRTTPAPDAKAAVNDYLLALQKNNYEGMYNMLTSGKPQRDHA